MLVGVIPIENIGKSVYFNYSGPDMAVHEKCICHTFSGRSGCALSLLSWYIPFLSVVSSSYPLFAEDGGAA